MAGKNYTLKLSDKDKTYEGQKPNKAGTAMEDHAYRTHEEEVNLMVSFLLKVKITENAVVIRNAETVDRFQNTKHNGHIDIDEEELKWLQDGMKESLPQRHLGWVKCKEILRQIEKPEEVDERSQNTIAENQEE